MRLIPIHSSAHCTLQARGFCFLRWWAKCWNFTCMKVNKLSGPECPMAYKNQTVVSSPTMTISTSLSFLEWHLLKREIDWDVERDIMTGYCHN